MEEKQRMKEAYSLLADQYERWQESLLDYDRLILSSLSLLEHVKTGAVRRKSLRIADVGASSGATSFALAEHCAGEVYGLELSASMVERAEKRKRLHPQCSRLHFIEADAAHCPLPADLDLVFAFLDTLNHLSAEELSPFFANIATSLKEGALFFADILSEQYFYEYLETHYAGRFDDTFLIWENSVSESPLSNEVRLHTFSPSGEADSSLWIKREVGFKEYFHEPELIVSCAEKAGLHLLFLGLSDAEEEPLLFDFSGRASVCPREALPALHFFDEALPARFLLVLGKTTH